MLDYGFATYSVIDMAPEKEITLEVKKGKEPTVSAIPDSGFSAVVKKGSGKNTEVIIEFEPSIEAPIEKGTQVGTVSYKIGDETVSVVPIRTVSSVEKADLGDFFIKIMKEILK